MVPQLVVTYFRKPYGCCLLLSKSLSADGPGVLCVAVCLRGGVVELGSVVGVDADILVDHVDIVIVVDNGY